MGAGDTEAEQLTAGSAQVVSSMRSGGVREMDPGRRGAVKLGAGQGWCVG